MSRETQKLFVKGTVTFVTGLAVAAVTTAAIKNNLPMDEMTKINKVMMGIGVVVISSMVADLGAGYTGNLVDTIFKSIEIIEKNLHNHIEEPT